MARPSEAPRILMAEMPRVFVGYLGRCPTPQEEVHKLRCQVKVLTARVVCLEATLSAALEAVELYAGRAVSAPACIRPLPQCEERP